MEKRRTIWPWILSLLLMVGLYPLSFGPACWLQSRGWLDGGRLATIYQPILVAACDGPPDLQKLVLWYASLGARENYGPAISRFTRPFEGRLVTRRVLLIWNWTGPMLH